MKRTLSATLVALLAVFGFSACGAHTTSAGGAKGSKDTGSQYTKSQNNAIKAAHNHLKAIHFSRDGLVNQLTSQGGDGYTRQDAAFAVDHIKVDWNKRAVDAAKDYLESMKLSRAGLIVQLETADDFTHAQAVYAADHVELN